MSPEFAEILERFQGHEERPLSFWGGGWGSAWPVAGGMASSERDGFAGSAVLVSWQRLFHNPPKPRALEPKENRMRMPLAFVVSTAAILAPALAMAGPVQPPNAGQPIVSSPTVKTDETVVVTGNAQKDDVAVYLDRVACRIEPPDTDTRIGGSRICVTVREWNNRQKKAQRALDNWFMNGRAYF